jgi:hypothetical protein
VIQDHDVRYESVHRAFGPRTLALPHSVPDNLAAAEFDLFAVDCEVALDFD